MCASHARPPSKTNRKNVAFSAKGRRQLSRKRVAVVKHTPESAEVDTCGLCHRKFKTITLTPE
jgi:hypothetical protein